MMATIVLSLSCHGGDNEGALQHPPKGALSVFYFITDTFYICRVAKGLSGIGGHSQHGRQHIP